MTWVLAIDLFDLDKVFEITVSGQPTKRWLSSFLKRAWQNMDDQDDHWDVYLIADLLPDGLLDGCYETWYGTVLVTQGSNYGQSNPHN